MNISKILGFAIGPIASALVGLATVPIMAWAFSPEDLGRMSILQVILSFSLLLGVLGLDQAYVREYHGSKDLPSLLKVCFVPGFFLLLVCSLGTSVFSQDLTFWLYGDEDPVIYILTLFSIFINYIARYLSLILRMQERGVAFSMSQVIPKVLQLVLLGLVMWLELVRDFLMLMWIFVTSLLAVLIIYAWNTFEQWSPAIKAEVKLKQLISLLKFGFPLVLSGLAYWGLTATSIFVLKGYSDLSELGIYTIASTLAGIAAIFQSIFTVVWAPTVYKWANSGIDMSRIDRVANQALLIFCFIFALAGSFSWLTDYLLPQHYIRVKYLVVCAIIPPLLYTLSEITSVGIGITRRNLLTVWITFAALVTNVLLSLWLIPIQGAAGAVVANAVAYFVFFIGRTEASFRVWRKFPRGRIYIFVLFFISLSIAMIWLGPIMSIHYTVLWILTLPLLVVYFKDELSDIMTFTRQLLHSDHIS